MWSRLVTEVAIEINKAEECDGSNLVWGCKGPLIIPWEDRSRIRPIRRFLSDRIFEQIGQILSDQEPSI